MEPALGMVELNSIAKGIETTDKMLKKAIVDLIDAYPVCPGKYIVLVSGDVGAVRDSVNAGIENAKEALVDNLIIPNIAKQIFPAIMGTTEVVVLNALGIFETFSCSSCIIAADAAVKAAKVDIIELRLAKGLGGKAFFVITGILEDIKSAMSAAEDSIKGFGLIHSTSIIPSPHQGLKKSIY